MFPLTIIIRGSNLFGDPGDDVDLFIPYVADTSVIFSGRYIQPNEFKDGYLDAEIIEIGDVIRKLAAGDSKTLYTILYGGEMASTPWFLNLKYIISSMVSMKYAEDIVKYLKTLDELEQYEKAARVFRFGLNYYKDRKIDTSAEIKAPEGGYTKDWFDGKMAELETAINDADQIMVQVKEGEEIKMYDHVTLVKALLQYLVGVRTTVFKVEEIIR